jgi:hypothetical protein
VDPRRITLRDALVRHKPFVACTAKDTRNTKSPPWPEVSVGLWSAFNIQTLNENYGHILDTVLPRDLADNLTPLSELNRVTVKDDNGARHLIGWGDTAVVPLVKWAK